MSDGKINKTLSFVLTIFGALTAIYFWFNVQPKNVYSVLMIFGGLFTTILGIYFMAQSQ